MRLSIWKFLLTLCTMHGQVNYSVDAWEGKAYEYGMQWLKGVGCPVDGLRFDPVNLIILGVQSRDAYKCGFCCLCFTDPCRSSRPLLVHTAVTNHA